MDGYMNVRGGHILFDCCLSDSKSKGWDPPASASTAVGLEVCMWLQLAFYLGARDSNTGLQVHLVSFFFNSTCFKERRESKLCVSLCVYVIA